MAHAAHGHETSKLSIPLATKVYVALMVLLVATYGLDHVPLGTWNLILSMVIAIVKAVMVVWFFMEAKWSSRLVLLSFACGLLMMFVCFVLTLADYITRT